MKTLSVRNLVVVGLALCWSAVAWAEKDHSMDSPVGESTRWIVDADDQSVNLGIDQFVFRTLGDKNGLDLIVLGDIDHMSIVSLDRVGERSSVKISMLASGDQIELINGNNDIDVIWNGDLAVSVDDGEILYGVDSDVKITASVVDVLRSLTQDQNLRRSLAQAVKKPSIGVGCAQTCRNQHPRPDDCDGWWDEYACCVNEAEYDFCRRACACYLMTNPIKRSACLTGASTLFILEGEVCAIDFLWFLW